MVIDNYRGCLNILNNINRGYFQTWFQLYTPSVYSILVLAMTVVEKYHSNYPISPENKRTITLELYPQLILTLKNLNLLSVEAESILLTQFNNINNEHLSQIMTLLIRMVNNPYFLDSTCHKKSNSRFTCF